MRSFLDRHPETELRTGTEAPSPGGDPLGVREELSRRLPPYAVPELVMALDQLPLNANGKIDYQALRSAQDAYL